MFKDEKNVLERRCASLQERVDGYMAEMASSPHADTLLCHVETLEKDRTSLQTVLEMKNQEVAQLRTKINEQVFEVGSNRRVSSSPRLYCVCILARRSPSIAETSGNGREPQSRSRLSPSAMAVQ